VLHKLWISLTIATCWVRVTLWNVLEWAVQSTLSNCLGVHFALVMIYCRKLLSCLHFASVGHHLEVMIMIYCRKILSCLHFASVGYHLEVIIDPSYSNLTIYPGCESGSFLGLKPVGGVSK